MKRATHMRHDTDTDVDTTNHYPTSSSISYVTPISDRVANVLCKWVVSLLERRDEHGMDECEEDIRSIER